MFVEEMYSNLTALTTLTELEWCKGKWNTGKNAAYIDTETPDYYAGS